MAWIGRKKIAFIPVYRPNVPPPDPPDVIPADWNGDILQRVLFDPDTTTGADKSLRAYIRAASSGRADLDAVVMPMVTIDQKDVPPDYLEGQLGGKLRDEGFDAAALVMLGLPGAGTGQAAGFWARFVMKEGVGVWAMELTHVLTGYWDLYIYLQPPDRWFDNMACNCGTHPCAFTKAALGWLDQSAIARHPGGPVTYQLHSVGLAQPPPTDRVTAVRIGSEVPYFMVEARQMVDQFDAIIPNNGVIVYEVVSEDESTDPKIQQPNLQLRTRTPLTTGMSYSPNANITVGIAAAISGGYSVLVSTPQPGQSPWTTVAEGSSAPGGHVTAVMTGPNRIALFIADPNGGIYTISGFGTEWGQWTTVAEGSSTPGARVAAVRTGPERIALFIADPNGGIYTISGFGTAWGQWTTVAEGSSTPGAPVTAMLTGPNQIALFIADAGGGIYTISGFETNWGQWRTVAEGSSAPGGHVTALMTGQNRIALFIADPNGGIYTISGFGNDWGQWRTVAEGSSAPGGHVTALMTGQNRIALFIADPNGGIYTISGFGNDWGQWTTVAQGSSRPGAPVTAVGTGQNLITVFLADPNGGIYNNSGFGAGWGQWTTVAEGSSAPGGHITALLTGQNRLALFIADPNGGIYTSSKLLLP